MKSATGGRQRGIYFIDIKKNVYFFFKYVFWGVE